MIKTLKWIYRLGILHERRRVKLLISEYQNERPQKPNTEDEQELDRFYRREAVWYEASDVLAKLTEPGLVAFTEQPVYKSPLEDE